MRSALAIVLALLTFQSQLEAQECQVVEFSMTPSADLQMVIWIEDLEGNYVDTVFITRTTGSHGLGNRPGIMEFNSAPMWCYGRRESTFPIWAHRHGMSWPKIIFQDNDDDDLSHPISQSSIETTYCRPLDPNADNDMNMWDMATCATTVYTDKGKYHESEQSLYPPRNDFVFDPTRDTADAMNMRELNPFDAVSRPTPIGGAHFGVNWSIPDGLAPGEYIAFVEVSKEFDQNDFYNYPSPSPISWSQYGIAYRGQPSVLYSSQFRIGDNEGAVFSADYVGYGDPEGQDGNVRPPDSTITSGVAGSGSGRLLITPSDQMYRLRVEAKSSDDNTPPGAATKIELVEVWPDRLDFEFVEPGDDGEEGRAASFEFRYIAGTTLDESNWEDAELAAIQLPPSGAGSSQLVSLDGLLPNTTYTVGVRASDECLNLGEISSLSFVTPRPEGGSVDACFIATAAYGSVLADEVVGLRKFRDRYLRSNVPGEILVESYYSFGPALAKLVDGSPLWRKSARALLAPIAERAKAAMQ